MTFPCLKSVANKHADVIAPHCIKVIHSSCPFADKIDGPLSFVLHYFVIVKYNSIIIIDAPFLPGYPFIDDKIIMHSWSEFLRIFTPCAHGSTTLCHIRMYSILW